MAATRFAPLARNWGWFVALGIILFLERKGPNTMKGKFSKLLAVVCGVVILVGAQAHAQQTTSPLVKQLYDGNWPSEEEAQKLRDELFYQRAIHSYMTMLPALNVIGMRDGSEAAFGKGYNVLPIWKDRMDARTWVPTPNADVIYSMSYLDLKETGPLVVAAPQAVIGMFTDFFQRTITDVGAIGPDRARGGLYLLLPPDYQGHVPDGYFAFRSSTYNVFLFFRTVLATAGRPGYAPAVAAAEQTRDLPTVGGREEHQADAVSQCLGQAGQHDVPHGFYLLGEAQGIRGL